MSKPPEMTSNEWAGCSLSEIVERAKWIADNALENPEKLEYECYDAMFTVRNRAGEKIAELHKEAAELSRRVNELQCELGDAYEKASAAGYAPPPARKPEKRDEWTDCLPYLYAEICLRAESNMERTGTVSGAHRNAFQQFLGERGLLHEAERELRSARGTLPDE